MKIHFLFDWWDFALMFRIYKNANHSNYHLTLDIQVLWFNVWITLFKKYRR